jgi:hypothetical protein
MCVDDITLYISSIRSNLNVTLIFMSANNYGTYFFKRRVFLIVKAAVRTSDITI